MNTAWTEVEVSRLTLSGRGLRCRQRRSIDEIAKSIHEFGFLQPIVVDDRYTVIIGKGRLEAAKRLGCKKVPVVLVSGLTDEQYQRLQIADNRLAQLSRWDRPELVDQMERLSETHPVDVPGFNREELCDLLGRTDMSKAKCEFPPELEKTAANSETHLLVSCRASDLDKMARLVAALSSESWCVLEQASR